MTVVARKLTADIYRPLSAGDLGASIDPFYLDRLEGVVDCKLPDDYVEFLRMFPRSGLCHDYVNDRPTGINGIECSSVEPDGTYEIEIILSQSKLDTCDLIWTMENSNEPRNEILWIANTGGSQAFGMRLREDKFGSIYYFDWDIEGGQEPLVAMSFTDFIERLIII